MRKQQNHDANKKKGSPRGKRKLEFIDKKKTKTPLSGKTIYLDLKDVRAKRRLEQDILRLGATVETFLSKDINYLITTNPPPKNKKDDLLGSPESPSMSTPSPFNMGPSPSPSNPDSVKKPVSRGKAIYDKARIAAQNNPTVENALKFGIKIVGFEVAQKWIQKEVAKLPSVKNTSQGKKGPKGDAFKVKTLKAPFVKFEDLSKQYKVVYQHLTTWPHINLDTPKGTCPFDGTRVGRDDESCVDRQDKIGMQNVIHHSDDDEEEQGRSGSPNVEGKEKKKNSESIIGPVKVMTAGEIRRRAERKKLQEKKRGYCECCQVKYENLDQHIRDEQHKIFVRDKKNYESLDHLIKTGTNCNTARFLQKTLTKHLQKGKKPCGEVDISIPEDKQWTPRKSSVVKMMMKSHRQKNKSLNHEVDNDKNLHKEVVDNVDTKSKKDGKTTNKSLFIEEGKIDDLGQKDGNKNESIKVSVDKKEEETDKTQDEINLDSSFARKTRNRKNEKEKNVVVNKIKNMTIESPVQVNLSALNMNTSGVENNESLNDSSSCKRPRKKVIENRKTDSCSYDAEVACHQEKNIDTCDLENKDLMRNSRTRACAKNEEVAKNSEQDVEMDDSVNDNDVITSRRTRSCDKNGISKNQQEDNINLKDPSMDIDVNVSVSNENSTKGDNKTKENDKKGDNKTKQDDKKKDQILQESEIKQVKKNALVKEKNHEENEMEVDIDNHYVPKVEKEYRLERNMCPNRVNWGDEDSIKSKPKDKKVKKWSQKLASKTKNLDAENANDEVDGNVNASIENKGKKVCSLEKDTEVTEANTSNRLIANLVNTYCDEKTIYIKSDDQAKISPRNKGRLSNVSPVFGKSPLLKHRTLQLPKNGDIYEFGNSPLKSRDVYDFDSEISLIEPGSPSLSRKNKGKNSGKKKANVTIDSPMSGISNTPRSSKRKQWRKKSSTPISDSGKKKLNRFKVSVENSTDNESVSDDSFISPVSKKNARSNSVCLSKQEKKLKEKPVEVISEKVSNLDKSEKSWKNDPAFQQTTSQTMEINASGKELINLKQNIIYSCSPSRKVGNGDAIKRLSPSKPFYPENDKSLDEKASKTPEKLHKKNKHKLSCDSGKGSSRKSPAKMLEWKSAVAEEKKSKKVKLNMSISLLSDRSVSKLLASENNNEQFEGFSQEDIVADSSLDSDASFVETNEIDLDENSHQEWVMDSKLLAINEDSNDIQNLVPEFTSPNKRSDSSWVDACETYFQSQFSSNASFSKFQLTSPSSPRRVPFYSPCKRKRLPSIHEENGIVKNVLRTPKRERKRRKLAVDGVEKVDSEIEFNHLSPQKIKTITQSMDGFEEERIPSSSPLKNLKETSNILSRKDQNSKDRKGGNKTNSCTKSKRTSKSPKYTGKKLDMSDDKISRDNVELASNSKTGSSKVKKKRKR